MNSFRLDAHALPKWLKAEGITDCFPYRGSSMTPTFKEGDFLYVRSTGCLAPGDVIVFFTPNENTFVIHRVVVNRGEFLVTRGDYNRLYDIPVSPHHVIGKVEFVETNRGIRRVLNGRLGLLTARFLWLILGANNFLRRLFWIPYHFLRQMRLVAYVWRPDISTMQLRSEEGLLVKYLYKNRTVAVWDPTRQRFACRKPFDLIIPSPLDEKLTS